MKNNIFSRPLTAQWSEYSKNYKENKESSVQFFHRKNRHILTNPYLSPEEKQIETFCLDLWAADANKKLLHLYFVEKSLRGFLENIKLPDLNGIIEYIKDNGFLSEQKILLPNRKPMSVSNDKAAFFSFGIHIPYENLDSGYTFSFMVNPNNEVVLVWVIAENRGWFTLNDYKSLLKDKSNESIEKLRIIQFAVNTVAYMNAFPDCVIDGVPEMVRQQQYYNENSLYLQISENVVDSVMRTENGKIISPHFRRGHFRKLTAERYTKMRGQIIFVHETMVNGKAKSIYTSDNIEKKFETH